MKFRKFAGVFAASALAVGLLAACGTGEKAEEGSTGGSKGGDTIKIGVNLELSGGVASYGTSELSGLNLQLKKLMQQAELTANKLNLLKSIISPSLPKQRTQRLN